MAPKFRSHSVAHRVAARRRRHGAPAAQSAAKVAARDQLAITVFGVEDLSGKFLVGGRRHSQRIRTRCDAGGGHGRRAGGTDSDCQAQRGRLLLNPQVTVEVVQTPNKKVMVTGAVRSPGQLPFGGELSVFEALALAGSATSDAGDLILIVRASGNGAAGGEGGT